MQPFTVILWLLGLLLVVGGSQGTPEQLSALNTTKLNALNITKQFDICSGTIGSPILYYNYTDKNCIPPFYLKDNNLDCGVQEWAGDDEKWVSDCDTYCQLTTIFVYAREAPYPASYCNYPLECSISDDHSVSWNWGFSVSPKMGKAFKLGISGSFGRSSGTSTGRSYKFTPQDGQCGYFTFVPIKKSV